VFSLTEPLRAPEGLVIGVPNIPDLTHYLERYFPNAQLEPISELRPYPRGQLEHLDAVVFSAEAGSIWTLVYPDFSVAVRQPEVVRIPMAYPMAAGDQRVLDFFDNWIELKHQDGTLRRLDEYWFQGKNVKKDAWRWSILHDVLGWVP
jgi:hypothetical protein